MRELNGRELAGFIKERQAKQVRQLRAVKKFPKLVIFYDNDNPVIAKYMSLKEQYGADILRLWVSSTDYQADVRISKEILAQLSEAYRKIRNTARYILGNISD